jgi:hypothetical protein
VLENARLLEPDGDQALITTREALIALDAWNLFRTGGWSRPAQVRRARADRRASA